MAIVPFQLCHPCCQHLNMVLQAFLLAIVLNSLPVKSQPPKIDIHDSFRSSMSTKKNKTFFDVACPNDSWIMSNSSCFYVREMESPISWNEAKKQCESLHPLASLPSVQSKEEEDFLSNVSPSLPFWLGASRLSVHWSQYKRFNYRNSSIWSWTMGGTLASFSNWSPGQPNNYFGIGEKCVRRIETGWDDHVCGDDIAKTIICRMDVKGFAASGDDRHAVFHGSTVAVIRYGSEKNLEHCELSLVKSNEKKRQKLRELQKEMPVIEMDFEKMLHLVQDCQNLDRQMKSSRLGNVSIWTSSSYLRGILPRTLWCGVDNSASSYHSLGHARDLDLCCRAHDFCPLKDRSDLLVKSHCACDKMFHDCLKELGSEDADWTGKIFFNGLGYSWMKEYLYGGMICVNTKQDGTFYDVETPINYKGPSN